jgi:thiol-disulfide isomerase/thioredoxin
MGLAIGMLLGGMILSRPVSLFASDRIEVGYSVPDFKLSSLDGMATSLIDFRGRPLILNFWASWCGPCREEMPLLQQVYEGLGDRIFVVGINYAEPSSHVLSFTHTIGVTFPILLDSKGEVAKRYQIAGFPTTFFLNSEGKLVAYHVGALTPDMLSTYLRVLGVEP